MIESSSRIIRLLQSRKAITLPVLYCSFALLFFFSASGVLIDDVKTHHFHFASGNSGYLLVQKPDLNIPAGIIPTALNPISDKSIRPAANNARDARSTLARNLVVLMLNWGNDSIHINWIPLTSLFEPRFVSFMSDFRTALTSISPKPFLTTAATWGVLTIRPAVELLNTQRNRNPMMTYELSAPWPGPVICRDASPL